MTDLLNGTVKIEMINKHYWELMEKYAGVEPPSDRPESAIDFPYNFYLDMEETHQTKYVLKFLHALDWHVYIYKLLYRKFVSEVLGYQFYRSFCKETHHRGYLHNCDFYGILEIGNSLK